MNHKSNSAPSSSPVVRQDPERAHLRDYMQVIWRRLWVIILAFVMVLGTTMVETLRSKPVYQATGLLEIQKSSGGALSLPNLFTEGLEMGVGGDREVNTEVEILKSRSVAKSAVQLSSYQLLLDRNERLYKKYFDRFAARLKDLLGLDKEEATKEKRARLSEAPQPLRLEVLDLPPINQPLTFKVIFGGDSTFRILDEDSQLISQGRIGEPFITPFFSCRFQGSPPPEGTVFPLTLRSTAAAVGELQANLQVSPVRNTRLIRLELTSLDQVEAQGLLAKVISAYQQIKIQQKTQTASKALEFIDQQLHAVDAEMQKAVEKLKQFKEEKGLISLSESTKASVGQLADLQKSQNEQMMLREQAKFLLTALQSQSPVDKESLYALGLGDFTRQQVLVTLAEELSRLQVQRAALRSQYKDLHPAVQAMDRKIAEMKGKIEAEVESALVSLGAQRMEMARQIQEAEKRLEKLPEAEKQLAELTRQAKVYQDTFSFMLQKKGELQVTRAGQIGDVWIAEHPYAPGGFIKPRPLLNMMLAAIVGLVLGIGLAFFFEYLDDSVKNADDIQAVVDLPLLGTIGHYLVSQDGLPPSRRYLPTLWDSRGQTAEAFRTFRSNLLFSAVDRPHRSMLFTSALPEEGKTSCASNLGIALSHMGKRVLLVDTDLRKPVMHRAFNSRRSPGLVDVLVEEDWQKALDEAVRPTELQNLDLLTCGRTPPNPNEMLGSEKMGRLMDLLAQRYDFVVFDSPPVLAVSDAMVLARRVDGVLLVVRGGRTSRGSVQNGVDLLNQTGARILGVVLNDIDFKRERYYYYYHSQYDYGYGEQSPETPEKRGRLRKLFGKSKSRRRNADDRSKTAD